MHVLQLVTNENAPFFRQQIRSLEEIGITSDVRSPAGIRDSTNSRSFLSYVQLLFDTITEESNDYDLIHANYGLTAPVLATKQTTPTVLSLWGSDLLGYMIHLSRFCAQYADEVVVMTPEMATKLERDCHVIPHGIDVSQFRPLSAVRARGEIGWSERGYHVLFPYSPDRKVKDFATAVSVVASVRQRLDEPVTLHTLSDVPHERMVYYYNAADAVLITSRSEGSPNTVREALACNCPVVATDVGDIRMRLSGVNSSAICQSSSELVDALIAILQSETEPDGRDRARETSAEVMAEQLKSVYDRAIEQYTYPDERRPFPRPVR